MRTTFEMTHRTFADVAMASAVTLRKYAQQVKAVVRLWSNRQAVIGLEEMDDYLLNDLGLTRTDVKHALRSGSYMADPSITLALQAKTRRSRSELSLG
ncbi:DUF1127 domain-containing protein [Allorhizobium terrae]|nr:DUF1127 domain-containing protein [Allorhizobium terrae]